MTHLLRILPLALVAWVCWASWAFGATPNDALGDALQILRKPEPARTAEAVQHLERLDSERAIDVLGALRDGKLLADSEGNGWIEQDGRFRRALNGAVGNPIGRREPIVLDNATRRLVETTVARLRLSSSRVEDRRAAAKELAERAESAAVEPVRALVAKESDAATKAAMALAIAKVDLQSPDAQSRIRAANVIAESNDVSMREQLEALVAKGAQGEPIERDPEVQKAIRSAIAAIALRELVVRTMANLIYGLSLGSILLLAALGLAITFGLMKVINMAHGEMLMLGAYVTFLVQGVFQSYLPASSGYYLLAAIPAAFLGTALVGLALERLVISKLYGRPLETLLATWGLSLLLIQTTRSFFGAQNVTVANPPWLIGGWELMPTIVVPYSRLAVLGFTAVVVGFVWFVLQRTSLGLKLRAITQNRDMAAALGIRTRHIDSLAFALGSGVAGLGGVALSQLGNVGPELGQQHIIDSFMVVILGGVGNIVGAILGAVGLGIAAKFIEPSIGAVLGKIAILVAIILFIQWRPQGMFALRGRAQEEA